MNKKIVITACHKCPEWNHSGVFTKGGAWPVCHAPGIVDWAEINKTLDYNDPKAGQKWSPPILPTNERRQSTDQQIPDWCPLPNNEETT